MAWSWQPWRYPDSDPEWREKYEKHLKSSHWNHLRQKALKRDGRKCSLCGATKNLIVHHLTYKNLGDEYLHELQVLCKKCHQTTHEREYGWKERKKRRGELQDMPSNITRITRRPRPLATLDDLEY